MVTASDHKYNYLVLRFLCATCNFPFVFDSKNVKMLLEISRWKQWIWYILYLNSVVCVTYQVLSLLLVLFIDEGEANFRHLSAHVVFAVSDPMMMFAAFNLFIRCPKLTAAIFNDVAGFVDGRRGNTPREKYIRVVVIGQVGLEIAMIALFFIMPESPQFFYGRLPTRFQIRIVFVFMMIYECATNVSILAPCFIALYIQICFFNTMSSRLQRWITDLTNDAISTSDKITKGYQRCIRAQRDIARFNQVFADVIFAVKNVLITNSILGFSVCIKHYDDRPMLAALFTSYGIQATTLFVQLYDDGYKIQDSIEEMTRLIKTATNSDEIGLDKKYVNALMRSIRPVGIQVGGFYYLERASTLIFFDFVVNQVVSVVLGTESV